MEEQQLRVLLAEYQALSTSIDRHATVGYAAVPLAITALGGYVALGHYSDPFAGVGISLLLLLIVVWLGIGHAIMQKIGVRLIEIELIVRNGTGVPPRERPAFYTSYIGQGAPGLDAYHGILVLVAIVVLLLASLNWWATMITWQWATTWRVIGVAIPVILNLLVYANIWHVERALRRKRNSLFIEFGTSTSEGDDPRN